MRKNQGNDYKNLALSFLVVIWLIIFFSGCAAGQQGSLTLSPASVTPSSLQTDGYVTDPVALPDIPDTTRLSTFVVQTGTKEPSAALSMVPNGTQQMPEIGSEITDQTPYLVAVIKDLMTRCSITKNAITVLSVEEKDWKSTALGCPLPGVAYAEVITHGYLIQLQAMNEIYTYHTDTVGEVVLLCGEDGTPILPEIPIQKDDDIKDATPWMPVD